MFGKKPTRCEYCDSKVNNKYSFCPYCGHAITDDEKHAKDYGLLGRNEEEFQEDQFASFGITDKLIGSLMNSLMKNLDKQFKNIDKNEKAEVRSYPNGIRIKIGTPVKQKRNTQNDFFKKSLSDDQLKKITSLPKKEAESKVKRLNNKIIYELNAPGIQSPQDIIISKLESGYEIKAISEKKIYVNSLPVNLPLKGFSFDKNTLFIEFSDQPPQQF
jgi:hypothetical protein